MRKLVAYKDISHEEWLLWRKKGITGTDASAVVNLNPYRSAFAVYLDKVTDDIETADNEAMKQGRDLEEYVAKRFSEQTGLKVRRANAIYYNEDHPFMLADFDRLVIGQKAGLECKTVSPYAAHQWDDDNIPIHYQIQVQQYLAVSGYDCWYIAALIFGKDFVIRKIERDEELIKHLVTIEERFWNDNVLARIMPDPDGTDKCSEEIAKLYFKSKKEKAVELLGFDSMLQRREELDALIKKMEKEKNTIDQKVKLEMKDATVGLSGKYKVSWPAVESTRLDTKRLKNEQPAVYADYCKTSSARRFTVSHVA